MQPSTEALPVPSLIHVRRVPAAEEYQPPRESMRNLPRVLQPYLTWVTGIPLRGERQLIPWSPERAGLLGIAQMVLGIAAGACAIAAWHWWSVPLLVLSWLITGGGMRRLDVVVVHQTLHRMFTRTARGDRVIGEVISTLLWRPPYDANRTEHLLHHQYPCSLKDADTRYLLSVGMRPGMTAAEYRWFLVRALLSPAHHWRFSSGRIRANYFSSMPRYRRAMALVFLAATLAGLWLTGLWMQYLILWIVPLSVVFQNATFLYTSSEHRWWIFGNAEKLTRAQRDLLTFGRFVGEPVPAASSSPARHALAWTAWWFRLLVLHSSYRLFVLVGDTVQHDLHHIRPAADWPNSGYVRNDDIDAGSERYTDVWGSLLDHLHAAGQVRRPAGARPVDPFLGEVELVPAAAAVVDGPAAAAVPDAVRVHS